MPRIDTGGGGAPPAPPDALPLNQRIAGLADLPIGDLREAWAQAWGAAPPKGARRRLLTLGVAWKWQVDILGGPSKRLQRRLASLEAGFREGGTVEVADPKRPRPARLLPGARLIRVWKEERHEVVVTETGFLWRGRSWTSLSAIAREITGGRRNGPAFFGLREGDAA